MGISKLHWLLGGALLCAGSSLVSCGSSGSSGADVHPTKDGGAEDSGVVAETDSGARGAGGGGAAGRPAAGGASAGGNSDAGETDGGGSCIDPARLPKPPSGTLQVSETCTAPTPCGGKLDGTALGVSYWCLGQDALFSQIRGLCGAASIGTPTGSNASGTASFSGGKLSLALHAEATVTATFPNACTFGRCSDLETNLASAGLFGNCSSDGSGGCFCSIQRFMDVTEQDTYTTTGNTLTTSNGRTFDYCTGGGGATVTETDGGGLGTITFTKPQPTPEICNGLDDDLNGIVDDSPVDCPPCNTVGVCSEFTAKCTGQNGWACTYTSPFYEATEVSCDGLDNDCDGTIDEGSPEVCDGRDNDCNGQIDENPAADTDCSTHHGPGYHCQGGQCVCADPCGGGCTDFQTDVANCGGCGKQCPALASCTAGACQCPSTAPTDCTTTCADLASDAKNCGKCGQTCAVACSNKACIEVKDIEMSDYTVCALLSDGTVRCWGNGSAGALGSGNTSYSATPAPVSNLSAVGLAAGTKCAWLSTGSAECWGENYFGDLGDGTKTERDRPVPVSGLSSVAGMAAASQFTCAWTTTGSAYCWGDGTSNQLGDPAAGSPTTPHLIPGLTSVSQISVGLQHTCALISGGTVKCWGSNIEGQTAGAASTPTTVTGLTGVAQISLGALHSCARLTNGTVDCWGDNQYGELGDGTFTEHGTPTPIPGLTGVTQIAAGGEHTCALLTDGTVECWGWNQDGELGDGTSTNRSAPVPVPGLTSVVKLVAGGETTCALLVSGDVACWGNSSFGQCGSAAKTNPVLTPTNIVW